MSTLKVNALRHNSASSDGVTLNSDGTAIMQVNGGMNFRNRIINGDMRIDQRNAGASITQTVAVAFPVDRFFIYGTVTSKFTAQQNAGSVTPPSGYTNYLGITSLAATSLAAGDYYEVYHRIEGFNVADLGWGTASAKTVTLSFQVRSSLTGTFGGSIANSANNRSYPFTYSIASANTWTSVSVTIPGDTSGTWLTNNGIGIAVQLSLGTGSTFSGTAGAWSGSNFLSATGATSVVGTNGATWYITGVQLEVGSVATPFERRDYGRELMMCQRYYWQVSGVGGSTTGCTIDGLYANSSGAGLFYSFMHPVVMRTAPTATVNYNDLTNASSVVVSTSIYGANVSANGGTTSSGRTQFNFTSTGFVKMSAEL
jgi:hypothetical protein